MTKHGTTLHLNLKRKWFDMILSGEKTEEYREIKPYWKDRLFQRIDNEDFFEEFDTITFSNGYAKDRNQFVIELSQIAFGYGVQDWGAERGKRYFVLHLGKILEEK